MITMKRGGPRADNNTIKHRWTSYCRPSCERTFYWRIFLYNRRNLLVPKCWSAI